MNIYEYFNIIFLSYFLFKAHIEIVSNWSSITKSSFDDVMHYLSCYKMAHVLQRQPRDSGFQRRATRSKQKHLSPSQYASLVMWMMCKPLSPIQEVLIGCAYVPQPDAEALNTDGNRGCELTLVIWVARSYEHFRKYQITIKSSCKCWKVIDLFAWHLWTSLHDSRWHVS